MKVVKLSIILIAAVLLSLGMSSTGYAFHSGGVAECEGCHTMHNSSGNVQMNSVNGHQTAQFQGKKFLLKGTDNSSTCLNCHSGATLSSYHVLTFPLPAAGAAPTNYTPGGDFAWVTMSQTQPAGSHAGNTAGERHGHNVVASDFNLVADTTLTTAPGGSYAASALSCASCHDPHARARVIDTNGTIAYPTFGQAVLPIGGSGSYSTSGSPDASTALGVYRILAGSNYSQMSYTNPLAFNADPPVASAPATYNRAESTSDTRVAYGKNMSEWCSNCHRAIHNDNVNAANTALIHPAGNNALLSATANDLAGNAAGTTIANIYNAYKKSGDLTGTSATSYDSLIPYEEGTNNLTTLQGHAVFNGSVTSGPAAGANVMCLSCHRAHASGFSSMTRWDNKDEILVADGVWPGSDVVGNTEAVATSLGLSQAQYQAAMYGRPATRYAFVQRSLCNKCHAKD